MQSVDNISKTNVNQYTLKMRFVPHREHDVHQIQCVRKVPVHLGYGRVQLKCDVIRRRTGGEVRKVAVHL